MMVVLAMLVSVAAGAQEWAIAEPTAQSPVPLPSGSTGAAQLSGIAWVGGSQFYVVGDSAAVVYPLSVAIDPDDGAISDLVLAPGIPLAAGDDLEGLAYDPVADTLLTADESGPAIRQHDAADGALLQTLAVPPVFAAHRPNLSLESLTRSPDGDALWTANEEALTVDGPVSSTGAGTIVRLQRFDANLAPSGQWAYVTDPLPGDIGAPGRDFEVSGVVDLAALPDGRLLVLERGLGGIGFRSRIYEVDISGATDVSAIADLSTAIFTPVSKILIHDRNTGENYEGMTLGPMLDDGIRSLMLVSDDAGAGGLAQRLRHLLLRPDPPVCQPEPLAGCAAAGASKVVAVSGNGRDQLVWSWRRGSLASATALLGSVTNGYALGYAVCVYDTLAGVPRLRIAADVPRRDGFGWQPRANGGMTYRDRDGTASGVRSIVVRPGTATAMVRVRASGPALGVPQPGGGPLLSRDPTVTVQLVNRSQPDRCLTASFTAAGRELPHRFAAKY